jgi:hypothetical protein
MDLVLIMTGILLLGKNLPYLRIYWKYILNISHWWSKCIRLGHNLYLGIQDISGSSSTFPKNAVYKECIPESSGNCQSSNTKNGPTIPRLLHGREPRQSWAWKHDKIFLVWNFNFGPCPWLIMRSRVPLLIFESKPRLIYEYYESCLTGNRQLEGYMFLLTLIQFFQSVRGNRRKGLNLAQDRASIFTVFYRDGTIYFAVWAFSSFARWPSSD